MWRELTSRVISAYGRIDILVNNAGGSYGDEFRRAPLVDLTEEDFDGCFEENLLSHFLVSKSVAPIMFESGQAGPSSTSPRGSDGRTGHPAANMGFYPVSKAAFTKLNA